MESDIAQAHSARSDDTGAANESPDIRMTPKPQIVSFDSPAPSATPKAFSQLRSRKSLSVTPTPVHGREDVECASGDEDWVENDGGDDAMLEWQAETGRGQSEDGDDASSVDPGDAGLPENEDSAEDEDAWGREAYLTWDSQATDEDDMERGFDDSDMDEPVEETADEMMRRGMPDYAEWTVKSLQVSTLPRV